MADKNRTIRIPFMTLLKLMPQILPNPWLVKPLVRLQVNKLLFRSQRHRCRHGLGGAIDQVSIRITELCNLRCHTCGQWGDEGYLKNKKPPFGDQQDVSSARYAVLLKELAASGQRPIVYIWGGEPTLYSGLYDVLRSAMRFNMPCAIATNGRRLSAAAPFFVDLPLFLLQVSIDGSDGRRHDAIRPSAGGKSAFESICKGLKALREERRRRGRSLPIVASLTVVSRHNQHDIVDIYEAFRDRVDLFVFYLSWWITEKRALDHELDFNARFGFRPALHRGWLGDWTPDDIVMLRRQFNQLRNESAAANRPPVVFIPDLGDGQQLGRYYDCHNELFGYDRCVSIFHAVELHPNGDMSPCRDYHDFIVGNVNDHTILDLWNSERYRGFRRSINNQGLMPVCSRCCGLMGY